MGAQKVPELGEEELASLNNTELRMLSEQRLGKYLNPYLPREMLIEFLLGKRDDLPTDKMYQIRYHMMAEFADNYPRYKSALYCGGNCVAHCDLQVLECQVQNKHLQHPTLFPSNVIVDPKPDVSGSKKTKEVKKS